MFALVVSDRLDTQGPHNYSTFTAILESGNYSAITIQTIVQDYPIGSWTRACGAEFNDEAICERPKSHPRIG